MKRRTLILFTILVLASLVFVACSENTEPSGDTTSADTTVSDTTAADTVSEISFTDEAENGVNVYKVKTVNTVEEIDWYAVPAVAIDTYKWVECDETEAYAQLVYVNDYGFICRMTAIESDPFTRYSKYGDPACLDSCMEFFVTFDGERYMNIEANSGGALYVGIGASRDDHTPADEIISLSEMIKATPEVEDGKWTLTIELPLEKLEKFYGKTMTDELFVSGFTFGGNFYKTECADNGNEHYGMWNEVASDFPDFHRPDSFGKFIIE